MDTNSHLWSAIIAGGQGTRLFPLSNDSCPKQFCQMDENNTFIQATAKRMFDVGVSPYRTVVITTNENQTRLAKEQLLQLGVISQNILQIDPKYGYAVAMVKAALFIYEYDQEAVIINTPSDQFINADADFEDTMKLAIRNAESGSPTIVGVKINDLVTFTGCGHAMFDLKDLSFCRAVTGFIEKPDEKTANNLMRKGNTACNTGINVWRATDLLESLVDIDFEKEKIGTSELMDRLTGLSIAVGGFEWHDCGTLKSYYDISKKTTHHKNASFGDVSRYNCRNSLFIALEDIAIDANYVENAAVIANMIDGKPVLTIVKLEDSQMVRQLAEDYIRNKGFLTNDFSSGARNNRVVRTSFSDAVSLGFVGVSNYDVVPIKKKDKITFIVTNERPEYEYD